MTTTFLLIAKLASAAVVFTAAVTLLVIGIDAAAPGPTAKGAVATVLRRQ